jgi:hypothetical protein
MSCPTCEKMRAYLPAAIRNRLAAVEHRMRQNALKRANTELRGPRLDLRYTIGKGEKQ